MGFLASSEVRFRFDCTGEGMVWIDGEPMQGLTGSANVDVSQRTDYLLWKVGDRERCPVFEILVEVACNGLFGNGGTDHFSLSSPAADNQFELKLCHLSIFSREAYSLMWDLRVMADMGKHLPAGHPQAANALYTANSMVNIIKTDDPATWKRASVLSKQFFALRNGDGQHLITATGHCHIDTAWLWPYAETKRKVPM